MGGALSTAGGNASFQANQHRKVVSQASKPSRMGRLCASPDCAKKVAVNPKGIKANPSWARMELTGRTMGA
jgi:hypothetical protein